MWILPALVIFINSFYINSIVKQWLRRYLASSLYMPIYVCVYMFVTIGNNRNPELSRLFLSGSYLIKFPSFNQASKLAFNRGIMTVYKNKPKYNIMYTTQFMHLQKNNQPFPVIRLYKRTIEKQNAMDRFSTKKTAGFSYIIYLYQFGTCFYLPLLYSLVFVKWKFFGKLVYKHPGDIAGERNSWLVFFSWVWKVRIEHSSCPPGLDVSGTATLAGKTFCVNLHKHIH